jgi:hypothetical protein
VRTGSTRRSSCRLTRWRTSSSCRRNGEGLLFPFFISRFQG